MGLKLESKFLLKITALNRDDKNQGSLMTKQVVQKV